MELKLESKRAAPGRPLHDGLGVERARPGEAAVADMAGRATSWPAIAWTFEAWSIDGLWIQGAGASQARVFSPVSDGAAIFAWLDDRRAVLRAEAEKGPRRVLPGDLLLDFLGRFGALDQRGMLIDPNRAAEYWRWSAHELSRDIVRLFIGFVTVELYSKSKSSANLDDLWSGLWAWAEESAALSLSLRTPPYTGHDAVSAVHHTMAKWIKDAGVTIDFVPGPPGGPLILDARPETARAALFLGLGVMAGAVDLPWALSLVHCALPECGRLALRDARRLRGDAKHQFCCDGHRWRFNARKRRPDKKAGATSDEAR